MEPDQQPPEQTTHQESITNEPIPLQTIQQPLLQPFSQQHTTHPLASPPSSPPPASSSPASPPKPPPPQPPEQSKNLAWLSLFSILIIIGIFSSGLYAPQGWNWAFIMALMIAFIAFIGKLITNRFSGILINDRNKMTLSRFQLVIWTLIVLSAFITIGLERVKAGVPDSFAIQLPQQLWELLGISAAALVGSPLVLSTKVGKEATPGAKRKAAVLRIKQGKNLENRRILADVERSGQTSVAAETLITREIETIDQNEDISGILDSNEKFGDAKFSEMFTGDEMGNKGYIDVAKVQMFFFTLIVAFGYMVLLVNLIMTTQPSGLSSFPLLTDSVVALLGISSAGYLTNKAVDHTKTA